MFAWALGSAVLSMSHPRPSSLNAIETSSALQAETNMDVFSGILMISMNDRVCAGFAQCDLNVALALRNAAALPDQEHELIHERKNRSHFAWQRALQFDARGRLDHGL